MSTTTTTPTIRWKGASGRSYEYFIFELPPRFKAAPGNYVFAKEVAPNRWSAVYIGQTGDLSERFDHHHVAACARRNGATHIHAHVNNAGETARFAEETDLVRNYGPPCNR